MVLVNTAQISYLTIGEPWSEEGRKMPLQCFFFMSKNSYFWLLS